MAIEFECFCGTWLGVDDQRGHQKVRCPRCGRHLTVPARSLRPVPYGTPVVAPVGESGGTSPAAIWSLVLGFLGFLGVPVPFSILLAGRAIMTISESHGALKGMGLAVGGLVLSLFWIAIAPFVWPRIEPDVMQWAPDSFRHAYDARRCRENLAAIGAAIQQYVEREGGREHYPRGTGRAFLRRLSGVDPARLRCPVSPGGGGGGAGLAYRGPGLTLSGKLPADTPIVCDEEGQHPEGLFVLRLDGRVELAPPGSDAYARALRATEGE